MEGSSRVTAQRRFYKGDRETAQGRFQKRDNSQKVPEGRQLREGSKGENSSRKVPEGRHQISRGETAQGRF